jgi:hypothetical protein
MAHGEWDETFDDYGAILLRRCPRCLKPMDLARISIKRTFRVGLSARTLCPNNHREPAWGFNFDLPTLERWIKHFHPRSVDG